MNDNLGDTVKELISTEMLNEFSILEKFCNECTKMTPHHIDEANITLEAVTDEEAEAEYIAPISAHECIYCRENEENWLNNVD